MKFDIAKLETVRPKLVIEDKGYCWQTPTMEFPFHRLDHLGRVEAFAKLQTLFGAMAIEFAEKCGVPVGKVDIRQMFNNGTLCYEFRLWAEKPPTPPKKPLLDGAIDV